MDNKTDSITSPWLTTEEAASYLRRQAGTLEKWRCEGTGPKYHQPGPKGIVLYLREDLDSWQMGGGTTADGASDAAAK